jgi:hypothetical protein
VSDGAVSSPAWTDLAHDDHRRDPPPDQSAGQRHPIEITSPRRDQVYDPDGYTCIGYGNPALSEPSAGLCGQSAPFIGVRARRGCVSLRIVPWYSRHEAAYCRETHHTVERSSIRG